MEFIVAFSESILRLSVPLLFAAFGGLISERSGLANVALEGMLLLSAFTGAAVAALIGDPWVGALAGVLAGGVGGLMFGSAALFSRADHIVMGTAFNLFIAGMIPTVTRAFFGVTGSTPQLERTARLPYDFGFFVLALLLGAVILWALNETRWGLRLRAAGDEPVALQVQGVSPLRVRLFASVLAGLVVGFGGIDLSLCQGSGYIRDMAGGRGFIALAALIFGGWRPVQTMLACLLFAAADATQILLQGKSIFDWAVPNSLVQTVPYIATLALLALRGRNALGRRSTGHAPIAINRPL